MKTKHDSSVTQAVSGDVTAAATDRPTCVAGGHRADPPAEAVAVIEPPKPDNLPVAAGSDEIHRLEGEMRFILLSIRKALGIDHDEGIGIVPTIEALIEDNDVLQKFADALEDDLEDAFDEIAKYKDRINELQIEVSAPSTAIDHSEQALNMVNHPPHYQGKVECIDAIESALGPDGFVAYCRGNALKYTFRAGRKGDAAEDLAKAAWYLQRIGQ